MCYSGLHVKRGLLTGSLPRFRCEPELETALGKLADATDRTPAHHLRAALRAYEPLRPYLAKGKR